MRACAEIANVLPEKRKSSYVESLVLLTYSRTN